MNYYTEISSECYYRILLKCKPAPPTFFFLHIFFFETTYLPILFLNSKGTAKSNASMNKINKLHK